MCNVLNWVNTTHVWCVFILPIKVQIENLMIINLKAHDERWLDLEYFLMIHISHYNAGHLYQSSLFRRIL